MVDCETMASETSYRSIVCVDRHGDLLWVSGSSKPYHASNYGHESRSGGEVVAQSGPMDLQYGTWYPAPYYLVVLDLLRISTRSSVSRMVVFLGGTSRTCSIALFQVLLPFENHLFKLWKPNDLLLLCHVIIAVDRRGDP